MHRNIRTYIWCRILTTNYMHTSVQRTIITAARLANLR